MQAVQLRQEEGWLTYPQAAPVARVPHAQRLIEAAAHLRGIGPRSLASQAPWRHSIIHGVQEEVTAQEIDRCKAKVVMQHDSCYNPHHLHSGKQHSLQSVSKKPCA